MNKKTKYLGIILAAGKGTRMKRKNAKAVNPIGGLPMINHVVNAAKKAGCEEIAVVVGQDKNEIQKTLENEKNVTFHMQKKQMGTAHAVLVAVERIGEKNLANRAVVVLNADNPLVGKNTIKKIMQKIKNNDLVVAGFNADKPKGYGRLVMEGKMPIEIKEEKDASQKEKKIKFCSSGIFAFQGNCMNSLLNKVKNDNKQKEYYLGDCVGIAHQKKLNVAAIEIDEKEAIGVNTPQQLAIAEQKWQEQKRNEMMEDGVLLLAPQTVMFHYDTRIETGAVVEQYVVFGENVVVKKNARIRAFSHLEGAVVAEECVIGPYARLREGTMLQKKTKIGNFVETKKAKIGKNSKVNHLAYMGDVSIGDNVNVGAGSITCNYDGVKKHKTKIGNNSFIGTNTALVAPVKIGKNAMTAAGSIITKDVKEAELAIARNKQVNKKRKNLNK